MVSCFGLGLALGSSVVACHGRGALVDAVSLTHDPCADDDCARRYRQASPTVGGAGHSVGTRTSVVSSPSSLVAGEPVGEVADDAVGSEELFLDVGEFAAGVFEEQPTVYGIEEREHVDE